jgi:hypothetical protein
MFMLGFPLLLIPFAIYNIIAFLMPDVTWGGVVSTVRALKSGHQWIYPQRACLHFYPAPPKERARPCRGRNTWPFRYGIGAVATE